MKNNKDFMLLLGFELKSSLGGAKRYYYKNYFYGEDFYYKNVSTGSLSYSENDIPETVEEMIDILYQVTLAYGIYCGRRGIQSELQSILGLNN